jgi:enoyl-CoA hydratase
MVLFGQRLTAAEAVSAGLAWRAYDSREEAVDAAIELGAGLDEVGASLVEALTRLIRTAPTLATHADALDLERYTQRWSTSRPEFLAGVRRMRDAVERSSAAR